jgi:cytochrome c oxidase assembly protein subunit 15
VLWRRGRFDRALKIKLSVGLALGGAQGFMGWYMVASGLVENPYVSHYRLAAHLGLAFFLFGYLLWVWDGLRADRPRPAGRASGKARAWVTGLVTLLVVQIVWGAFVAGLNAGYFYNTFPTMQGYWLPPHGGQLEPFARNLVDNPATVQFIHRTLGILLLALTVAAWASLARDPTVDAVRRRIFHGFAGLILVQFWLGVFTLVLVMPISLATLHQVTACLLTGTAVLMLVRFNQTVEETP